MKLSTPQKEVLLRLAGCDEPLAYFKGGYWTLPSLGLTMKFNDQGYEVSVTLPIQRIQRIWHVSTGTVHSLERLGLLGKSHKATNYHVDLFPNLNDRVLTKQGFALSQTLK